MKLPPFGALMKLPPFGAAKSFLLFLKPLFKYDIIASKTVMETVFTGGTESYTLVYLYDEHGSPIGLRYRTPSYSAGVFDGYFFEKNIQGDITGIWDQNGTKVVSTGMTYSAGFVDNFLKPDDYANHFIDINAGYSYGIDHCFNPEYLYGCTTRATSLSFGSGINYGVGYDYYFAPWTIAKWGTNNEI